MNGLTGAFLTLTTLFGSWFSGLSDFILGTRYDGAAGCAELVDEYDVVDGRVSVVGRTAVSKDSGGLAAVVDDGFDDENDDEVRTLPGLVKALSLCSLSSTVIVTEGFDDDESVIILRFGTKIAGFVGGFILAGCL